MGKCQKWPPNHQPVMADVKNAQRRIHLDAAWAYEFPADSLQPDANHGAGRFTYIEAKKHHGSHLGKLFEQCSESLGIIPLNPGWVKYDSPFLDYYNPQISPIYCVV